MASADLAAQLRDPWWFPWRFDEARDGFQLRRVTRDDHRRVTFLTDAYLGAGHVTPLPRDTVVGAGLTQAPLHFVFHSAFCLSTVLARAFDIPGVAMGLKEPNLFNDIAGWQLRGAQPPVLAGALDAGLTLLARPFAPGEAVVVKPSNVANNLIGAVLKMRPQSRALLLHAPLPVYLGSIARKGLDGRLWVRDLLMKQLRQGLHDLGFGPEDYLGQSDLQVAAMGWLAQQALFQRLAGQFGDRVVRFDSDWLLAQPDTAMALLGRHFGLVLDANAVVAGPAFQRHSKSGASFDAAARAAEQAAEAAHADEIAKVVVWAQAVADTAGVVMAPAHP